MEDDGDLKCPKPLQRGGPVVSIVERLEQKRRARLRVQSAKRHNRELELAVDWFDMRSQIESVKLDAEIARLRRTDTEAERRYKGELRCLRAFQRCLRGEVEAGHAEWAEVIADVPGLALPYLLRGRWQMDSHPREALVDFDRATETEPEAASAYFRRGECYAKLGDNERALANYRRALGLEPDSIDGLYATGQALVALGNLSEATKFYNQAIARAPRYVDFYEARAIVLEAQDQHAAALADYERILELDPTRGVTHYARARCRARMGNVDGAIEELEALGVQDADVFHVPLLLGKLLMEKQRFSRAGEAFSRALELAPDNVEALAHRALVLARLGDRERGIADADRARALAPERPEYVYTAIALRYLGSDPAGMIAALEDPIARFPDVPLFLRQRAELYENQGDSERALADWDWVLAKWPPDAEALLGRAKALGTKGRYPEALEALSRAIALEHGNAWAYGLRAHYASQNGGDDALIAADWARAAELDPDHLAIRYCRGQYLMHKELYEAAVADFDRMIALAPTHGEAYYLRAFCRCRLGDAQAEAGTWEEDESSCTARYRACVADLERAIELGYLTDDVFIELHLTNWYLDEADAARAALDRGIAALPTCSTLWQVRSDYRLDLNDDAGAEADRLKAEQLEAAEELTD
jgi:tetratricopeptide (TPR) repeat protein